MILATRRRAEEFSALVDASARSGWDAGRGAGEGDPDGDTARLLALVSQLRAEAQGLGAAGVRPAFRDDLRERLVREAPAALAPLAAARAAEREPVRGAAAEPPADQVLSQRARTRRERRVAVLAGAALLVGGTAGMAGAAQGSLPGEALYPAKRGIEHLTARLAGSDADRGRDLLDQATTRLEEARELSAGSPEQAAQVPGTVEDFTDLARTGSGLLLDSYRRGEDRTAVRDVRAAVSRDLRELTDLAAEAPDRARPALLDAVTALQGIDADARGACPTCSSLPALSMPTVFRTSHETQRALAAGGREPRDDHHVAPKDPVRVLDDPRGSPSRQAGSSPSGAPTGGASTSTAPRTPSGPAPEATAGAAAPDPQPPEASQAPQPAQPPPPESSLPSVPAAPSLPSDPVPSSDGSPENGNGNGDGGGDGLGSLDGLVSTLQPSPTGGPDLPLP